MADGVRGKQYENFPREIQKGILLHRAIDTFTDAHPIIVARKQNGMTKCFFMTQDL